MVPEKPSEDSNFGGQAEYLALLHPVNLRWNPTLYLNNLWDHSFQVFMFNLPGVQFEICSNWMSHGTWDQPDF